MAAWFYAQFSNVTAPHLGRYRFTGRNGVALFGYSYVPASFTLISLKKFLTVPSRTQHLQHWTCSAITESMSYLAVNALQVGLPTYVCICIGTSTECIEAKQHN